MTARGTLLASGSIIGEAQEPLTGGALLSQQDHPTPTVPDTLPEPPLPGGLAEAIRWFFHVPQWIQIGGAVLALLLGGWLTYWLWSRRADLWQWLRNRRTTIQIALAIAVAAAILAAGSLLRVSWNYTQHSNEFCTACHIMADPFQRFQQSEHASLECHDCHQQPITASLRQVYLWVLERPEEIGPHSPVPDDRCAGCHIRDDPEDTWERIAATAGHRVHLESDSAALDTAMCVTCHGVQVHRFVPVDQTCGQAGCHAAEETRIVLGRMAGQTGLHCVGCHEFTAPVPEDTSRDTAFRALVPGERQCLGCHEMQRIVADLQVEEDPHAGACGWCHDPHTQARPDAAFATCTGSGCHDRADTLSAFHRGLAHGTVEDCGACHRAHDWTADGEDCAGCHAEIAGGRRASVEPGTGAGSFASPPAAPRAAAAAREHRDLFGPSAGSSRAGPSPGQSSRGGSFPPEDFRTGASAGDTLPYRRAYRPFDHRDHTNLSCRSCHSSTKRHGEVTVTTARECASCHHDPRVGGSRCASCHAESSLGSTLSVTRPLRLAVWDGARIRALSFNHRAHDEIRCAECHRSRPFLRSERACSDCHQEHHEPDTDCSSCHRRPPEDTHDLEVHSTSCTGAGCHGTEGPTSSATHWERTRPFCLSCHTDERDHEPGARCVDCHLLPPLHSRGGEGA